MRIQDLLKFSFDLILPGRLARARQHRPPSPPDMQEQRFDDAGAPSSKPRKARSIIEDLDYEEFGGPSFGPQTMKLMEDVLDDIQKEAPTPLSPDELRRIAIAILKAAADGERDADRLKAKALASPLAQAGFAVEDRER